MGAVALIEFRNEAGRTRAASWPGSDETYEAPIFSRWLDDRLPADGSTPPLSRFYDHSQANGEGEEAAVWFPIADGLRTLGALVESFEWLTPGEATFSPGEMVAGVPADEVYQSLRTMHATLAEAAGRGEPKFRFRVCD